MKTFRKYELPVKDEFEIEMPRGADVLTVQVQCDVPYVWALIDTSKPPKVRRFRLYGAEHEVDTALGLKYVGAFQIMGGALVMLLCEVVGHPLPDGAGGRT